MNLWDILDKLVDYTGMDEAKQDHVEAALKLEVLAAYHGLHIAGKVDEAAKLVEFGGRYLGFVDSDWLLFQDKPTA